NEQLILGKKIDTPVEWIRGEEAARNLIGVQGCAWSEFIDDCSHLEYMVFPRLLAVSELGWTPSSRRDWDSFKQRMNSQVKNLRSRDINCYTLSDRVDISSVASNGSVVVTLECEKYPSEVRYTTDGSVPTSESPVYLSPITVGAPTVVKASRFVGGVPVGLDSLTVCTDSSEVEYYPYIEPDHWKNL
ncbi:MAG: chitobiase/beta-hexosaminidase C-terminal domain-containing protein, partial [Candidatus Cryptobacteroides sp.]